MIGDDAERHSGCAEGQRGGHHKKAHRFVENDSFESAEAKTANEQREAEFSPTQPNQSAKCADKRSADERRHQSAPFINSYAQVANQATKYFACGTRALHRDL